MAGALESALAAGGRTGLGPLRDIRGIEGVPWWPLADGWWMLLGVLALLGFAAWHWRTVLRLRLPIPGLTLGSWRRDAAGALRDLRRRARAGQDPKTTAGELSELLRRIAMARLGRAACAGLAGRDWLAWLAANDPLGFPWDTRGQLLLDLPYAPPDGAGTCGPADPLPGLIDAAYAWLWAPDPRRPKAAAPAARGGWRGPWATGWATPWATPWATGRLARLRPGWLPGADTGRSGGPVSGAAPNPVSDPVSDPARPGSAHV